MRFSSAAAFRDWPQKAVAVFGMSGVGKTTLGRLLRAHDWFFYSVDYRIGTRYMGEAIADNFKREAMTVPFLRKLLLSDSLYIGSNITIERLEPLSTYLGKPGNPEKGGLSLAEYRRRQAQHRQGEIRALTDVEAFIKRARSLYNYTNFLCDCSGSLCEVIDISNGNDPVLEMLRRHCLLLYVRGTASHAETLIERFRQAPKPMYYDPLFLERSWARYKAEQGLSHDHEVDPDAFAVWGFGQLLARRLPLYEEIAARYGYTVTMEELQGIRNSDEFVALIGDVIRAAEG